jgi:hypothetical protein
MKSIYIYFKGEMADIYYKDNEKNLHTSINLYTKSEKIRNQFRVNLLERYWEKIEITDLDELKSIVKRSFVQVFTKYCENFDKND